MTHELSLQVEMEAAREKVKTGEWKLRKYTHRKSKVWETFAEIMKDDAQSAGFVMCRLLLAMLFTHLITTKLARPTRHGARIPVLDKPDQLWVGLKLKTLNKNKIKKHYPITA